MKKPVETPPVPHVDATYYLTRDSNCAGEITDSVDVWYRKPIRCRLSFDRGYVWMPSSPKDDASKARKDLGLYGAYTLSQARGMFTTIPDTDGECVRCEMRVPAC